MVQWLKLQAPNEGGLGSIPDQGTRFHSESESHSVVSSSLAAIYLKSALPGTKSLLRRCQGRGAPPVGWAIHSTLLPSTDSACPWAAVSLGPVSLAAPPTPTQSSDFATPRTIHSPWNSPGQNTGVGSLSLLQGIFPTQGSNQVSHIAGRFFTS